MNVVLPANASELSPKTLSVRLRLRRRRTDLDRALASGIDPSSSPELLVRAQELDQPATRRQIAACLGNLIDAAEEPDVTWRAQGAEPPVRSGHVLRARDELQALGDALTCASAPATRGVALAAGLVWDRQSPIYSALSGEDVAMSARSARAALAQ